MAVAMINSRATIYQFSADRWNDNKKNTKKIRLSCTNDK